MKWMKRYNDEPTRRWHATLLLVCVAALWALNVGCSAESAGDFGGDETAASGRNVNSATGDPGAGVGQSGAQDFGRFR